jgi:hypothetical protein
MLLTNSGVPILLIAAFDNIGGGVIKTSNLLVGK